MIRLFNTVVELYCPRWSYIKEACKFHTALTMRKVEDRKGMMASLPDKDEGTSGEKSIDIDTLIQKKEKFFPGVKTYHQLYNGIPFAELPICNIRVSPNNTVISVTDNKGIPRLIRSCGIEGFKNTRKGTNIAAQATAITISEKAIELGWKTVRVKVRGLGPGRMSAIKGLQMGGLNIVSITDATPVSWNPPRARKQRSL
ncbi:28S ribosomal protein S11, mitochondrial [Bactrocera neohumeralis]|uniref:28S ribosomal protein S11, mitochondrial n=1 Tax=Bactrocera tryoni TaxID=59916 RepID=UPI001A974E69|nr:28S ribosomal protein S11, mitochondrial [Bactrocera tryoni]XP_050337679.1 28S ribosomal protein S11, mitochondrial [Bactrocera neohumeralis]